MQQAFILGNPRSGTSLLRLMLDSHPEIAAPPECGFLHWWFKKYAAWIWDSSALESFIEDLLTSRKIETWSLDRAQLRGFIHKHKPITYGELGLCIYQFWASQIGKAPSVILDKNNYYIHHLGDLLQIWPQAKFLFLIRDGRDVACSYKEIELLSTNSPYKPKLSTQIDVIAQEWLRNNANIVTFLTSLSGDRWLMIKYEDLVTETERELKRITEFFGLPYSTEMLNYHLREAEPESTLDWKLKTREMPDKYNVGKYKTKLAPSEIEIFNNIANEMLKIGGYE